MKNLGTRSGLMLLTLAGCWTSAVADACRNHRGETDSEGAYRDHPERGDVPGWVMLTLMSAVLVAGLLALAGPALEAMFNQAMDKVGK
jgi:hypothetical protein